MVSIALPPAKRARYAAPTEPHTPRAPLASAATNERLHSVLTKGVLPFLTLDSAAAVLASCRLMRSDTQLAAAAARALSDWPLLFAPDHRLVYRLQDHWVDELAAVAPPEQPAQVLSTAAFLKKRVQRWCFSFDPQRVDPDDDLLCSVRPVLVPLAQLRNPPTTWTRQPIHEALNRLCAGGGDAFFAANSPAESRFATHWDSIYIDRVSGRVSCRLCDAVRDSVALYKRQVQTGVRQYGLLLRHKQYTWQGKPAAEVAQLTVAFYASYFKADAYIRPECAEWPDAKLLRHICDHGNFQTWQIGDTRARGIATTDALLEAVAFSYQHQCRTFYQPLKKSLHGKCQVVGRIPHAVLRGDQVVKDTTTREVQELVGGVECSSGIFCGVQVTFRLKG